MFYQACRSGGKYALALAGATSAFVFLEEYTAYLREEALGKYVEKGEAEGVSRKTTWRKGGAVWWDGAVAGTILGTAVGLMCELNRSSRAIRIGRRRSTYTRATSPRTGLAVYQFRRSPRRHTVDIAGHSR